MIRRERAVTIARELIAFKRPGTPDSDSVILARAFLEELKREGLLLDRSDAMIGALMSGKIITEVAAIFKVSPSRVSQVATSRLGKGWFKHLTGEGAEVRSKTIHRIRSQVQKRRRGYGPAYRQV